MLRMDRRMLAPDRGLLLHKTGSCSLHCMSASISMRIQHLHIANDLPENASSGRTRRSISCGDAASSNASALSIFSDGLPSSGANWRHATRMVKVYRSTLEERGKRTPPSDRTQWKEEQCYAMMMFSDNIDRVNKQIFVRYARSIGFCKIISS